MRFALWLFSLTLFAACDTSEPASETPSPLGTYQATLTGDVELSLSGSATATVYPFDVPESDDQAVLLGFRPAFSASSSGSASLSPAFTFSLSESDLEADVISFDELDIRGSSGSYQGDAASPGFWRAESGSMTFTYHGVDGVAGSFDIQFSEFLLSEGQARAFRAVGTFEAIYLEL